MKGLCGAGMGGELLPGALWVQAQDKPVINKDMIDAAARIAGVEISDEYKQMMLESLNDHGKGFDEIFQLHIPNSVEPALLFVPDTAGGKVSTPKMPLRMSAAAAAALYNNPDDIAVAPRREPVEVLRIRRISST